MFIDFREKERDEGREGGRERWRERERNINRLPPIRTPNGDQTLNLGMSMSPDGN